MDILAIDPGVSVGVAFCIGGKYHTHVVDTTDTREHFYSLVNRDVWDLIICERYIASGRLSKYGIHTIELVGAAKAIAALRDIKFLIDPPQARIAYTARAREILGGTNYVDHEMDALAHLLGYQHKNNLIKIKV